MRTPTVALASYRSGPGAEPGWRRVDGLLALGDWSAESHRSAGAAFPVKHCARPNVSVICWLTMPSVSAKALPRTCRPTTTACFPSSNPWLPAPTGLSTNCVNTDLIPSGLQPTLDGWAKAVMARTGANYSSVYAALRHLGRPTPLPAHLALHQLGATPLTCLRAAVADGVYRKIQAKRKPCILSSTCPRAFRRCAKP